jgi:ABC-2 type transport system permease protein
VRYLRLYGHFLRFSFARSAQFRVDFLFRVAMDTLWYGHYLVFFAVLTAQTGTVGGYDVHEMRLFTGTLFVVDAFHMTFTANGLWTFPLLVNKGDLDYHLLRPVSTLYVVGLRDVSVPSSINLLMATGVLVWAVATYPHAIPWTSWLAYVPLLFVGLSIHAGLHLLSLLPTFWTQSTRGLRDVFWTSCDYANRPVGVYRGWIRRLVLLVPLAFVVSYPTRVLIEGPRASIVLPSLLAGVATWVVVAITWRRGLRAYGSASS